MALIRQVGTEESVLGYMTEPGQWAGGFAAWDEFGVYFATGRAENPGRVLRLDSAELRRLSEQWFPFGLHFIDGLVNTVRRIESTARQREALVALGTLSAGLAHELNNPASAATRAVDALHDTTEQVLASLARLAAGGITAEQYTALDGLRLEVSGEGSGLVGLVARRPRGRAVRLAHRPRRRPRLGDRPGARGGRRRRRLVRAARGGAARGLARPRPGVGLGVAVDGGAGAGGQGGHRAGVRPRRGRAVLLPDGPRLAAEHRPGRGARQHAGDDGARARHGDHGRAALRTRACRRSRRWPASSTRCGPTSSTTPSTRWAARAPSPSRRGPTRRRAGSSSRSPTPGPACPPRCRPTRSSRSSRPRTSARAPGSAWTSPGASSSNVTRGTSTSSRARVARWCVYGCPSATGADT